MGRRNGGVGEDRQIVREPQRLDRLLAAIPRIGSRSRARQALESGKVTVDGAPVGLADAGSALEAGAVVVVDWDRPGTSLDAVRGRRKVADAGVVVLYDDPDVTHKIGASVLDALGSSRRVLTLDELSSRRLDPREWLFSPQEERALDQYLEQVHRAAHEMVAEITGVPTLLKVTPFSP